MCTAEKTRRERVAHRLLLDRDVLEIVEADRVERVRRPRGEPVDRRVVDERRVEAAARARRVADRRRGEDDVQVRAHAVDEEAPQLVGRLLEPRLDRVLAHAVVDAGQLVLGVEVGDLARVQDVVDVLEEALVLDLRVVEEERRRLVEHADLLEEPLHVVVPLDHAVLLRDLDHKDVVLGRVAREPADRLAADAADADEHHRAARQPQRAVDAADVADRVLEEHEIHGEQLGLEVVVL